MNRSRILLLIIVILMGSIWGCGRIKQKREKEHEVDFTVVGENQIPEEIHRVAEEKKQEEFQMTYQDEDMLYLIQGYGIQSSGGYSIQVESVMENDTELHIKTKLLGPAGKKEEKEGISCPYIVIKVENRHKKVVFD